MSEPKILLGFSEDGTQFEAPLFHTFFDATSGHGKTLAMRSIIQRFAERNPDWSILVLDVKDRPEYIDLGRVVPVCFVETTEPLDLKALLEPIVGSSMMYYFDKIIEEAIFDKLRDIQQSIEGKISQADAGKIKIHGKELGKLRVLNHLLKKLTALIERPDIKPTLELGPGINVMKVSLPGVQTSLKRAYQQLVVRSVLVKLLEPEYEKVLLLIDESHRWNPQRYSSICKQALSELNAEGRSKEVFVIMADQALTKVDKEPLKPVKIWIIGQQLQEHEVDDAIRAVSDITDLTFNRKDIKNLKMGFFIGVDGINRRVSKFYFLPYGVPEDIGRKVAIGELSPEYVRDNFLKKKEVEDDMVWKEKYDQLVQEFEEWKKSVWQHYEVKDAKELEQLITTLRQQNEEMRKAIFNYQTRDEEFEHSKVLTSRDQSIVNLKEQIDRNKKEFEDAKAGWEKDAIKLNNELANAEKTIETLKERLENFEALGEALTKILPTSKPIPPKDVPSEVSVSTEQPAISVKVEHKQLVLSDKDLLGKIALIYAQGELGIDWFTVSDVTRIFEKHAWPRDPRTSATLDNMVQWSFLEKRYSGKRPEYKVNLTVEEAKKRSLLRVEG